jgi:hypothetical protein
MLSKCCTEHLKLKQTLFIVLDVTEAAGLTVFPMFGTLLSIVRDGGTTLIPWETDIDLGVVGTDPSPINAAFASTMLPNRAHAFVTCNVKRSSNRSRNGHCSDIYNIFSSTTPSEPYRGGARVEIWPYRVDTASQARAEGQTVVSIANLDGSSSVLIPVRRREYTLPLDMILPLSEGGDNRTVPFHCGLWGRRMRCPSRSVDFLDLEYHGRGWMHPKTIHWGANNVKPWSNRSVA